MYNILQFKTDDYMEILGDFITLTRGPDAIFLLDRRL